MQYGITYDYNLFSPFANGLCTSNTHHTFNVFTTYDNALFDREVLHNSIIQKTDDDHALFGIMKIIAAKVVFLMGCPIDTASCKNGNNKL